MRENERLTDKVVALTSENLALKGASPADLQLRLAQLEAQLAVKNKLLFGKSSERRPVERDDAPEKKPRWATARASSLRCRSWRSSSRSTTPT